MRTALIVFPAAVDAADAPSQETLIEHLAEQLHEVGIEQVVVLLPPWRTADPELLPGIDVLNVATTMDTVLALRAFVATAKTLDLVAGDLVSHRAAIEQVVHPPGSGAAALVTEEPVDRASLPVRIEDGLIVESTSPQGTMRDLRWFAHVLHIGPSALGELQEALTDLTQALERAAASEAEAQGPRCHDRGVHELVLAALVSRATSVRAVPADGFVVRLVTNDAERRAAAEALSVIDEEQVRLRRAVKPRDGFFTTYFVSPYSRYIARWCAQRGLTPNQVTVVSLLVGVIAAMCFALGSFGWLVAGSLLLQLAFTLDCVDGQLARYTRNFSAFGAWLDAVFDRAKEAAVYGGLAMGAIRLGADDTIWWLAAAALALQTFRHHLDFGYAIQSEATRVPHRPRSLRLDDLRSGVRLPPHGNVAQVDPAPIEPSPQPDGGLLRAAQVVGRVRGLHWFKSIIILPIGERFALISVTAIVFGPRGTFIALLSWGVIAAAYLATGRVLRTAR
jgi:hypothetical protein